MNDEEALDIIYAAIHEVNFDPNRRRPLIPCNPDTILRGDDDVVDSLDLLSILAGAEMSLHDEGYDLDLTDDHAVSVHPWTTVATLRDFIVVETA